MLKQLKWNKFLFMVTDFLKKIIHGNKHRTQRVRENHLRGPKSLDKAASCSEQLIQKQNSVKTCTKSPKKETPSIYGNRCSLNQKRKSCSSKAGMNWLKPY